MAAMYQIPPDKFVKDLQKRNGVVEIYDQIANEKVLELLQQTRRSESLSAASDEGAENLSISCIVADNLVGRVLLAPEGVRRCVVETSFTF